MWYNLTYLKKLLGTFLTTIISLLCLVVPLKMGPGASDEVL